MDRILSGECEREMGVERGGCVSMPVSECAREQEVASKINPSPISQSLIPGEFPSGIPGGIAIELSNSRAQNELWLPDISCSRKGRFLLLENSFVVALCFVHVTTCKRLNHRFHSILLILEREL